MKTHPVADLFPLMAGAEFDQLVEDIRAHGLLDPIKTWKEQLIDGRNRLRACEAAGVAPIFQELELADEQAVINYIVSVNIHRRHLNPGQIGMLGERLRAPLAAAAKERLDENRKKCGVTAQPNRWKERALPRPENKASLSRSGRVDHQLGKMLGVGADTMFRAHTVATKSPELADKVRSGEMRLSAAYKQVTSKKAARAAEIDDARRQAIGRDYLDNNKTWEQLRAEYGVSNTIIRGAVAQEKGRREPQVDPSTLSLSAQEKLDAAIAQEKRRLAAEFHQAVQAELKQAIDETVLPQYLKEIAQARQVTEARNGVMPRRDYLLIAACLHPDQSASKERLQQAFIAFTKHELVLCSEKEMPTTAPKMPRTYAEMMQAREAMKARRRKSSNGVQQKD